MVKEKSGSITEVAAVWKPIIDELTFNKVQERLRKNKNKYKPSERKVHPFPLTELINCGECGKSMGGKSGNGRKGKYFYYGHAQLKNPLAKEMAPKCQIKNVRALRLEEIVLKSLKSLLADDGLLTKWINIYKEKATHDLPEIKQKQKQLDLEIQATGKRIDNLVQRISELPVDVSADLFYRQIAQMNQKLQDLKLSKERVRTVEP